MMRKKLNIIIVGDAEVGKTSLLKCYDGKPFTNVHLRTVGVDCVEKKLEIEGKPVLVKLWDTAGQERFRTLTQQFYKQADGIIVAFDLTNQQSFRNIEPWLKSIDKNCDEKMPKVLVGNKIDSVDKSDAQYQEISEKAEQLSARTSMSFFQTSAKTNTNVEEMAAYIIDRVFKYKESPTEGDSPIQLVSRPSTLPEEES